MKKITSALLAILSIFPCCADRHKVPSYPLTKISYSYGSQMIQFPSYDVTLQQVGDSVFAIRFDYNATTYSYYLVTKPGIMKELKQVIIDEKIYKYKDHYVNPNVLDGDRWRYYAVFSDDVDDRHGHMEFLQSSGSNAGPRGKGLSVLSHAMDEALKDAQFLYICDENGQEIKPEEENLEEENNEE